MSDNWLRYVPVDPAFQPSVSAARQAEALLRSYFPLAEEIVSEFTPRTVFVDPGANWSGVHCPSCGAEAESWWQEAMSACAESEFASLTTRAPCCGTSVSLNEMRYVWPAAFGRYVLEAMNPNAKGLSELQAAALAAVIGCLMREIPVHI